MEKVKVGVIGCGTISDRYLTWCPKFTILEVTACADIVAERAQQKAAQYGIRAQTIDELLANPEIEIVLNLTVPDVHADVSLAAIRAGKSVYSEKPLALKRANGQEILAAAREQGVLLGCAPDTFLGGGLQTCRKLIDDGWIGTPVAAVAFMAGHGPESWHPAPDFFYQVGGGPMFDMGPYYLTALIHLLGPVRRVTGSTRISFPQRIATSDRLPPEEYGRTIDVEVPTHVAGVLDFEAGPVGTLVTSFDVWAHHLPRIEIYGSEGSLSAPDPNTFRGPVKLRRAGADEWSDIPLSHSSDVERGIGVADMAYALRTGRPHRASGELAYHVLDVMHAVHESSEGGQHVTITSTVERPAPLPSALAPGTLDT